MVERRTRDRKVAGSSPCRSGGRFFFLQGQLSVLTLVSVSVPPPLWHQHAKDPVNEKCKSDQLINQNQRSLYPGVLEFGYIHSLAMDDALAFRLDSSESCEKLHSLALSLENSESCEKLHSLAFSLHSSESCERFHSLAFSLVRKAVKCSTHWRLA